MIKLLNSSKQALHLLTKVKDYYIESELQTADKIIHFSIVSNDELLADLIQENYLRTADDMFVIKEINAKEKGYIEVFGKLDTDALKANVVGVYESIERDISFVLQDTLAATGWTYLLTDLPVKARTIRIENATPHAIIVNAINAYGFEVVFDTLNKVVKVYQVVGQDRGAYVYTDLNMKKLEIQGDTYDFRTRLYPYGKDNLNIAAINSGLEYIENHSYSNKIVEAIWRDDRYTVAVNLKADAEARLAILAKPRVSYIVDVLELSKLNTMYTVLAYQLGDTIRIIDKDNSTKDTQRIVKLTHYPLTPEKNKIELANVKIVFQDNSTEIRDVVSNEIVKLRTDLMVEINANTNLITNSNGGYIITRLNETNQPYEQLIMDTTSVLTAVKVWRWNVAGLGYSSTGYNGPYELAITADGRINASFITTGYLNAVRIRAGLLSSTNGISWIDLDNGYFKLGGMELNATGFSLKLSSGLTVEQELVSTTTAANTYAATQASNAQSAAVVAAALDATTKANAAKVAAEAYALAKANLAETNASAYADGVVNAEEALRIAQDTATLNAAATDATTKANAAKVAAQTYADTASSTAQSAAQAYALAQAEAKRVLAEAYADGIVNAEEAARIADVNAKLATAQAYADTTATTAKNAAIAIAATDATTKANAAQAAAQAYALAEAEAKKVLAQAYADGIVDAEEVLRIADVNAKLATAKTYAETQAAAAQTAANSYTNTVANGKESLWIKSAIEPSVKVEGLIWLDTSVEPNIPKRYVSGEWVTIGPTTAADVGAYSADLGAEAMTKAVNIETSIKNGEIVTSVINSNALATLLSGKTDAAAVGTLITTSLTGVNTAISTAQATANGAASAFNTVENYMDFTVGGLLLGKSDSSLKVNITNAELQFLNGTMKVAYITGDNMKITNANILSKLKVGVHEIQKYNGDITIVRWVGDDN